MKKSMITLFTVTALMVSLNSCKDKAKEANTSEAEAVAVTEAESQKYIADVAASTIEWKGFKPTGSHNGTILIENGVLNLKDGKLNSGTFLIKMNSIKVLDIPEEDEGNAKLVGHLKNADFFDVENHPTAAFEITGVTETEGKMMLSGNLTLKETKNNVTFPVTITNTDDTVTLTSETFTIDRSKWNVKYGSKSFFDNLGDKFINDDIEIKINVTANKKA
ncbi:YceI family protein [Oceanihabitans sp. IOP_32]|uniref:YceI family protein n=1 Tax=Oceanihabitans sp. IOP_32 TaxID=2529032 RepID=UPI001293BCA7|nr:YceI family protein [Oceanihabitans sp. IOP_32]QFZ55792.1 YceI family protein [Oceanihabitans sp. IOP_32]